MANKLVDMVYRIAGIPRTVEEYTDLLIHKNIPRAEVLIESMDGDRGFNWAVDGKKVTIKAAPE